MGHVPTYLTRVLAIFQFVFATANLAHAQPAEPELRLANLHNVYFPDRHPHAVGPSNAGNVVFGPPPGRFYGLEGDTVSIPFTLRSAAAGEVTLQVQIRQNEEPLTSAVQVQLLRARDVRVEGNSNGNCSCPAGRLPVTVDGKQMDCAEEATDQTTPRACPTSSQRRKIAATYVRNAPFYTKDPLQPIGRDRATVRVAANTTELFLVDIPISSTLPKGDLQVSIAIESASDAKQKLVVPLRVLRLKLSHFPAAQLSYWLSEDPRDLVAKPDDVPLNASWGGAWWSEEHWGHLAHAAQALARIGATSTVVPLFVRNPYGINATPLVGVRCIPLGAADESETGSQPHTAFGQGDSGWKYTFDFNNFHRWISVFRRAGFKQFEGAHLAANAGQLPNALECDRVPAAGEGSQTVRRFRFMPRTDANMNDAQGSFPAQTNATERERIYRETFLPDFLDALNSELRKAKIADQYVQHVIDENRPTTEARGAYFEIAAMVRKHLPGIRTIDAMNQYTAPGYHDAIDIPVVHLALLYDDQMRRQGIRTEVDAAYSGPRYFYNTAFREGGPNRFLDTNPMESRVYGWMLLELGYDGMLYWAANAFRYPHTRNLDGLKRPDDWNPFDYSIGPFPNRSVEPGLASGSNWILYPGSQGLLDSIRGRRLRDGLVDHWLYLRAKKACGRQTDCNSRLANLLQQLTSDPQRVADFSRDPSQYDRARQVMIDILEPEVETQGTR